MKSVNPTYKRMTLMVSLSFLGLFLMSNTNVQASSSHTDEISTRGIVSLTPDESIALLKRIQTDPAARLVGKKIIRDADKALNEAPTPSETIVTSGEAVKNGDNANSSQAAEQAKATYTLALAFEMTRTEAYAEQARRFLTIWAKTYRPDGDSVAATKFVPMMRAYDLIANILPIEDRTLIDGWFNGIAAAVIADQEQGRAEKSTRGINNHRSHALLVVAAIGCVTGNQQLIRYVTNKSGFLDHVATNLANYPNTPSGLGLDYHERQAIHYVAYNLQALTQLAIILNRLGHLEGNPYKIDYNPYSVDVGGASIQRTMSAFLPYAAGETQSTEEFANSENRNDHKRVENGSLSMAFNRRDAVPVLANSYYFGNSINGINGQSYNLVNIAADILSSISAKNSLPAQYPTPEFLVNQITSPM